MESESNDPATDRRLTKGIKVEPTGETNGELMQKLDQKIANLKRNKIGSLSHYSSNHHHHQQNRHSLIRSHSHPYGHHFPPFTGISTAHKSSSHSSNSSSPMGQSNHHSSNFLLHHPNFHSYDRHPYQSSQISRHSRVPSPIQYKRPSGLNPMKQEVMPMYDEDSLSNSTSPPILNLAMNSPYVSQSNTGFNVSSYNHPTTAAIIVASPPNHVSPPMTSPPPSNRNVSYTIPQSSRSASNIFGTPGPYDANPGSSYGSFMPSSAPPVFHRNHPFTNFQFNSLDPNHNMIRNPPTSIPVSVVTSLADLQRRSMNQHLTNGVLASASAQVSNNINLMMVENDVTQHIRSNIMNTPVVTAGNRRTQPVSVISTGTRTSSRPDVVTGASFGGGGGAESTLSGHDTSQTEVHPQQMSPPLVNLRVAGNGHHDPNLGRNISKLLSQTPSKHLTGSRILNQRLPTAKPSGNPHKPFECPECGKHLASKNVYQLHMRSHTGEKPFVCPLCQGAFSQKTSLTRHMRSHTGERPYACPECNKRFADKERIKIHMRTHTGEKPFSCHICGKTFSQKSTVKRHMSVHTGDRPYKCPSCGKGFANRGNLTAHIKTHSANHYGPETNCQMSRSSGSGSGSPPPQFTRDSNGREIIYHNRAPHPHLQSSNQSLTV